VSEWREVRLGEVATISWGDTSTTKAKYVDEGYPAFSASGKDGLLPYFDHEGDAVVISAIGAQCGKSWFASGRWSSIKNTMWMKATPGTATARYLFYLAQRPEFWPRRGSAQPFISLGDAQQVTAVLPPLSTQQRIGSALSAFDELIAINERRIELLEDLARSLYREWCSQQSDWTECKLFELAEVGFGFSFKSKGFGQDGSRAVVRIRDVPRSFTNTFTDEMCDSKYAVQDGDVLVGMDGDFHLNQWSGGDAWLNQRVARLRARNGLSTYQLMLALREPIAQLNHSIVGTTVAHLGKRHLEALALPMPPESTQQLLTPIFDSVSASVVTLSRHNRALTRTRDLLLPRLVTGRLDISDVDLGALLPDEDAA